MWICKECGNGYFEDCSPYYATCLYCNNNGSSIDEIADWVEDEEEE